MIVLGFPGIERVSSSFVDELEAMASRLMLDPNGIAAVISQESRFNPQAVNPHSGATGLIQFMPSTAKKLGTTVEALRQMTDLEQLMFVERFFKPFAGKLHSRGDYYMAVFMPAFLGKPRDTVLEMRLDGRMVPFVKGEKPYDQNAGLDVNGDGKITVGDVHDSIDKVWRKAGAPLPQNPLGGGAVPG